MESKNNARKRTLRYKSVSIPSELHGTVILAGLLLEKGWANVHQINVCLKKAGTQGGLFSQELLKRRFITIAQLIEVRRAIRQHTFAEFMARLTQEYRISYQNNVVSLEHIVHVKKFGRYRIVRELGRGGMGIVYACHDPSLGRIVALKTLRSSQGHEEFQRFFREARLVASLSHPNIVRVYEIGREQEPPYFTMDYIEGLDLDQYNKQTTPSLNTKLDIIQQVAGALGYAHSKGVIHRDVKSANILMDSMEIPHLTDFGLARGRRSEREGLTLSGVAIGTPAYMAPEQAQGRRSAVGPHSDQYSLGVVMYEILVGRLPYRGNSWRQVLQAAMLEEPMAPRRLVPELPREVETICLKAMEKDPTKRYVSMQAMQQDINLFLAGHPIMARPQGLVQRVFKWLRRHKVTTISLIFSLALVILLLAYWYSPGTLTIISDPPGAQIFIDKQSLNDQRTPLYQYPLAKGPHHIRLVLSDYQPTSLVVHILPRKENRIEKILPREKGFLSLTASQAEISALLEHTVSQNKLHLQVPFYRLPLATGTYRVHLSKINYEDRTFQLTVRPQKTTEQRVHLRSIYQWRFAESACIKACEVADFNGDGEYELVYCTADHLYCLALPSLKRRWSLPFENKAPQQDLQMVVTDINRNGYPDIIISTYHDVHIIDGYQPQSLARLGHLHPYINICDLNRDGFPELVMGTKYDGLVAYDAHRHQTIWKARIPEYITSYAAFEDINRDGIPEVFQGNYSKRFYCVNGRDGRILWSVPVGDIVTSLTPLLQDINNDKITDVIFATLNGTLYAVDSRNGHIHWQHPLDNMVHSSTLACDVTQDGQPELFLATAHYIFCLNAATGQPRWRVNLQGQIHLVDLEHDGRWELLVAASHTNQLFILDALTGKQRRCYQLDDLENIAAIWDFDRNGYPDILIRGRKHIAALRNDPDDCQLDLNTQEPLVALPHFADLDQDGACEQVLANSHAVYCIDGKSQQLRWQFNIDSGWSGRPCHADVNRDQVQDLIFIGHHRRYLKALDGQNGHLLWQRFSRSSFWDIVLQDLDNDKQPDLVTVECKGQLTRLRARDGQVVWQRPIDTKCVNFLVLHHFNQDRILDVLVLGLCSLSAIDGRNGNFIWRARLPFACHYAQPLLADLDGDQQLEILLGGDNGHLYVCDLHSGRVRWEHRFTIYRINGPLRLYDSNNDHLPEVLLTSSNQMYTFDPRQQQIIWQWQVPSPYPNVIIKTWLQELTGDHTRDIIVATSNKGIHFLDGRTGNWLGALRCWGNPHNSEILLVDYDHDNNIDLLFYVEDRGVFGIRDLKRFVQHLQQRDLHVRSLVTQPDLLRTADWALLFSYQEFALLRQRLARDQTTDAYSYLRYYYKGMLSFLQQNYVQAYQSLQQCMSQGGRLPEGLFTLALSMLKIDRVNAINIPLELILKPTPQTFFRLYQLYASRLNMLEQKRFIQISAPVIKKYRHQIELLLYNHRHQHHYQQERLCLEGLLTFTPVSAAEQRKRYQQDYLRCLRKCYTDLLGIKDITATLQLLNRGLRYLPHSGELYNLRAKFYLARHKFGKALQDYQHLEKLMGESARTLHAQVFCYMHLSRWQNALRLWQRLMRKYPQHRALALEMIAKVQQLRRRH